MIPQTAKAHFCAFLIASAAIAVPATAWADSSRDDERQPDAELPAAADLLAGDEATDDETTDGEAADDEIAADDEALGDQAAAEEALDTAASQEQGRTAPPQPAELEEVEDSDDLEDRDAAQTAESPDELEARQERPDQAPGTRGESDRINRLRAFLAGVSDENAADSPTVARLREVGSRLVPTQSPHLPLHPYVIDPRWNEAMQMLADDDCEDALELATQVLGPADLHVDGEPGVAYAFGRMQMCAGERRQGRQILERLAEQDDALGILAKRSLGQAAQAPADDESRSLSAHIAQGRQMARDGDVDEALDHLRQLRGGLSSSWNQHLVRFAEAEILEDIGRTDEAAMAYLGIYRRARAWRSSDSIAEKIEDAEERLGRQIIPFGDRVDRMRGLIARGRYRHAHQVSRENAQIRNVSGTEIRGWTRYRQALQNERQRNRERAVAQFEEAESLIEDEDIRPRLYFGWARALRRTGGEQEAIALYRRLCDEYPTNHLCDYALYEAGRLLQFQNDHEEARELFAQVVGLYPFSEHVPDALWRSALSAYVTDDFEAAIPPLKQIVEHYGDLSDASELSIGLKARYWIGVNHLKLGNEQQARQWLQETINEGPLTWYGRLAATRLEDAGLPARVRLPTEQLTRDRIEEFATLRLPDNPRLSVAAELARIGLYEEALTEVRRQQGVHPEPEGAVQLRAALHLAVDEPNWAHWIMKSVIGEEGPTHRTLRDWGFAFPLNYFELAHRHAEQIGVSPFLIQAIMRQESGFRPTVRSHAGAMGLMQLMPGTARYTARTFYEGQQLSHRQILDEDTNVRLGTMYIRIHVAHASDHPAMALAGYNAGPGALQSWFERFGDREIDAFVESITYRETRGYVRKVMTSFITYQGLYGDGDLPRIEIRLPENLRDWGELPELEDVEEGQPVSMLF